MMPLSTRPPLVLYVAWHPGFANGGGLALAMFEHYRRDLYVNVAGGAGVPVHYRSAPAPGGHLPIDVDLEAADASAVVLLVDANWAGDPAWVGWAVDLAARAEAAGLRARVFPVAIDGEATRIGLSEQAARWDLWSALPAEARRRRLISNLTYQFCRMLRAHLERLRRPAEPEASLLQYLTKVELFLSHSKADDAGAVIARKVRDHLHGGDGLESFFDLHDIPVGLQFDKVLLLKVKVSAVIAIQTDSFSSREWCRREVLEAKRWSVPLIVLNSMSDIDERGFPYLGNVPVVRMEPSAADRIDVVIGRLLDEVLKNFLWRCWIERVGPVPTGVAFVPRSPELISLASPSVRSATTLVYPEPPIGVEERLLFEAIAPGLRLLSMVEWMAEGTS